MFRNAEDVISVDPTQILISSKLKGWRNNIVIMIILICLYKYIIGSLQLNYE